MKDTFKTASFISGRAAAGLDPTVSYSATRLRRVVNPAWNFTPPYSFQGSTSGYTSGGTQNPPAYNIIDKFPFASNANATDVGDLTAVKYDATGQSSSTSGYTSGGVLVLNNTIEKFPFASNANATDVGDLTQGRDLPAGQSSSTSGYTSGGNTPPAPTPTVYVNTIDKFPFASDANATDVGDLTQARNGPVGQTSSTSGYSSGGIVLVPAVTRVNIIDKFPFATNANATDVGDLSLIRQSGGGQNSSTDGYFSGGTDGPDYSNIIDKFPFASDANATDVGDLTQARYKAAGQSSTASGYTSGGSDPTFYTNIIDKFPFASNANATDVGDLTVRRWGVAGQQV